MTNSLTYQIASVNGLLVADDDGSSVLLVNLSTTVPIFLGNSNSFGVAAGSDDSVPLAPQASMVADGSVKWYAAVAQGTSAELSALPGGTQYDNPVGVQIALSALGLATAANQTTQNNTALATNNVLGTGIALPVGAAKDASVLGTTSAVGSISNQGWSANSGLAKESGGNLASAQGLLAGTTAGALVSGTGRSIAQDMLHANVGTTTEIAALIASGSASGTPGGVPLLNQLQLLLNFTGIAALVVPGGPGEVGVGGQNQNQPAIEGWVSAGNDGASTATLCPLLCSIQWFDANSNYLVADEFWMIPGQSESAPHVVFFRGPTKGAKAQMTFTNFNATAGNSVQVTGIVYQSSRVPDQFSVLSTNTGVLTGGFGTQVIFPTGVANGTPQIAPNDPQAGILADFNNISVAAAATDTFFLPLWRGPIFISGSTGSDAADLSISIQDVSTRLVNGGTNSLIAQFTTSAAGVLIPSEAVLPGAQCLVSVHNANASARSPNVMIMAVEH